MFPFKNLAACAEITTVWLLVVLQLASICIKDMGSTAVPNKRSLGATDSSDGGQRMVAPAAAASLFAFSLANDILGGYFHYVVLLTVVCFGLGVAAAAESHGSMGRASRRRTNGFVRT
ncbi:hypothetical protein H4582DRAFT_1975202 [Lactarius indigo]|nr:hypothetical protein H4582DRAFT_1975202 [Lactarius indigo]